MQKELSVFKSTVLLYIMVILLPFGFYFIHSSFLIIKQDTKVLAKVNQINTDRYRMLNPLYTKQPDLLIRTIDNNLHDISSWAKDSDNQAYYIGGNSLTDDFRSVQAYCNTCKKEMLQHNYDKLKNLIYNDHRLDDFVTVIEKMVYIKQEKILNIFYIVLAAIIILMLLSIYLIRLYIEYQMNKHSIYDLETHLYNHNYLMEHLKTTCARAARYKYPLSLLSISITGIDKKNMDEKEYATFMETMGDMLLSLTRTSDVACRYDTNHIAIILPFTEDKNAEILKGRIEETFRRHNFDISQVPEFKFSIVQYETKESPKEYIERAEKVLHEQV
jgi:diguanylate cyclase (GGDEF)-like protein